MSHQLDDQESRRLAIQDELDSARDQSERNRMGQFATPTGLAREILRHAREQLPESDAVRFIDPAIGTGSFYSAFRRFFSDNRVACAVGYEIDPLYGKSASELWRDSRLEIRIDDFTQAEAPQDSERFNLLICNPPYVRHHHIPSEDKRRLKARTREACGVNMNGLSGLYCYFLGISHQWMADGALAGWLIPSEFMDVNYGSAVKRYLLEKVTLLHIHRFDPNDVQFGDALVSSTVVWFTNRRPPSGHQVRMTFGGSLLNPKLERLVPTVSLRDGAKWTQYPIKADNPVSNAPVLADFFTIKRGLATGSNRYFILPKEEIEERGLPAEVFSPILPSPRHLPVAEVMADDDGNPMLERRLFLLDCRLAEERVRIEHPGLWSYLEEGMSQGVADRYICRHRSPWYAQEVRPAAPFLCTYLGRSDKKRGRPFRFIFNHSNATAPNVYLMLYPKDVVARAFDASPPLKRQVWELLNRIGVEELLGEARVYGGGLHKLEPRELGRVPAVPLASLLPLATAAERQQLGLFETASANETPIEGMPVPVSRRARSRPRPANTSPSNL